MAKSFLNLLQNCQLDGAADATSIQSQNAATCAWWLNGDRPTCFELTFWIVRMKRAISDLNDCFAPHDAKGSNTGGAKNMSTWQRVLWRRDQARKAGRVAVKVLCSAEVFVEVTQD